MRPMRVRTMAVAMAMAGGISLAAGPGWSAPTCPLSYNQTDAAKSHKLFLYFPAADDPTFPNYSFGVSPARKFDVADLDPSIGTTAALRSRVQDVVVDDYCEFNVQVLQTTTSPETLPSPPARRSTVAIGSDTNGAWGLAQDGDLGDKINVDFAREWAGTYVTCEGGNELGGCSMTGSLTGANSTLDHWAQAIGGTAAHEAGHTYGLSHSDDNPHTNDCSGDDGPAPLAGEDSLKKHLMPAGCNLAGQDRADFRRHFSDRTFGLLATNVGLSIQTMHNWDMVNPNAATAKSLAIDFLSTLPAVTADWWWSGPTSPWTNPVVSGPSGTAVWQGKTFKKYRITWSKGNPAWSGTPGVLPGGAPFHVGATFTGVDFNKPEPIIIQNITLFDGNSNPLILHPRLPIYDAGTLDAPSGSFSMHFFPPVDGGAALTLQSATVYQLPRVASIESMNGAGRPLTFDNQPITPWSASRCSTSVDGSSTVSCVLGNLADPPHVQVTRRVGEPGVYDCSNGVPRTGLRTGGDTPFSPDPEGPICAGTSRDPFPSTTIYVIATFVDPRAQYWDPAVQKMVVGPLATKVFYQFAGVRDPRRLTATN
jgi:hypothetical protein